MLCHWKPCPWGDGMLQEAACHQLLISSIIFSHPKSLAIGCVCTIFVQCSFQDGLLNRNETQLQGVKHQHPACVVARVCDMMLMANWSLDKKFMPASCSLGKMRNVTGNVCIASLFCAVGTTLILSAMAPLILYVFALTSNNYEQTGTWLIVVSSI